MARSAGIAVTGATGAIGGAVATRLARKGAEQRLVVRDAERAPHLPGAVVVEASYDDPVAMREALSGITTLFFVSVKSSAERLREQTTAVDAAVAAGVSRIVHLSVIGAAPQATFSFARDQHLIERRIRESGLVGTVLRPALYADNVPHFCSVDGVIRGPAGDGRVSWVAREDVADAAVGVLLGSGHDGSSYEITGPAALTMRETAAALAEITGREIRFEDETPAGARASRAGSGPPWEVEDWVSSYEAAANGEMASVSGAVRKLTGRDPQSLLSFLRTHAETYQHLLLARYRQH